MDIIYDYDCTGEYVDDKIKQERKKLALELRSPRKIPEIPTSVSEMAEEIKRDLSGEKFIVQQNVNMQYTIKLADGHILYAGNIVKLFLRDPDHGEVNGTCAFLDYQGGKFFEVLDIIGTGFIETGFNIGNAVEIQYDRMQKDLIFVADDKSTWGGEKEPTLPQENTIIEIYNETWIDRLYNWYCRRKGRHGGDYV